MSTASDLVKGIGELAKSLTGYFNPSAYEARVLRGLVGTGDRLAEWAQRAKCEIKNKQILKYLDHYIRKWESDRSKLR